MRNAQLNFALCVCLVVALAGTVWAGPLVDEATPYNRGGYDAAVELWRRLADKGLPEAQDALGLMYSSGEGMPQDYVQAHMWFNLAASRYLDQKERDRAARNRDLVASKMTAAQIAEAEKLAREWEPR